MRFGMLKSTCRLAVIAVGILTPLTQLQAQQPAIAPPPVEFHGLLQVWAAGDDSINTFRVRRAEVKAAGRITDDVAWVILVDPSKVFSDVSRVLEDAAITFKLHPRFLLDAGQMKMPIGREGLESSAALDLPERALLASGPNKFGDVRGIGMQMRVTAPAGIQLAAGAFNAIVDQANRVDVNGDKALIGRLVIPIAQYVSVGATGGAIAHERSAAEDGHRLGADALLRIRRTTLKAEYIRGEDGLVTREGYYVLGAQQLSERFGISARYDVWRPDVGPGTAALREQDYVAGVNYFLRGNAAKLQASFFHKTFDGAPSQDLFIVNMQASW